MLSKIYSSHKREETGFTLIELLVVVIIIGILAAIALPIFIDQSKVAVDASVQSDVRNSVTNITNAQAQEQSSAKAALSNTKTRVVLTSSTTISTATRGGANSVAELTGVPALGAAYTVCGYNEDGKKFTGASGAGFSFSAASGLFSTVANCVSPTPAGGSAPNPDPTGTSTPAGGSAPSTNPFGTGTSPSGSSSGTTDPYVNDPANQQLTPIVTDITIGDRSDYSHNGYTFQTGTAASPTVFTGKANATSHSTTVPFFDGLAPSNSFVWTQQLQYFDIQRKIYDKDGDLISNNYGSSCTVLNELVSKDYYVSSGIKPNATSDGYRSTLNCDQGGFINSAGTGWSTAADLRDALRGGHITYVDINGVTSTMAISPTAAVHS